MNFALCPYHVEEERDQHRERSRAERREGVAKRSYDVIKSLQ
jgi:hypothetical protein